MGKDPGLSPENEKALDAFFMNDREPKLCCLVNNSRIPTEATEAFNLPKRKPLCRSCLHEVMNILVQLMKEAKK